MSNHHNHRRTNHLNPNHRTHRVRRPRRHRWPVCPVTGLQRLGEPKDARLALRAAARSRSRADIRGGDATWHVARWWSCGDCQGIHLAAGPTTPRTAA